jgi:hypothetical protein
LDRWFIQYFFGGVRQGKFFFRSLSITCPIPNPIPIFSARWQLLNPTPFSFSEPQVTVAETDTVFFCSPNSATVAVVVAETDFFFSLEIFRHSTAISPKRKLVGLLFE